MDYFLLDEEIEVAGRRRKGEDADEMRTGPVRMGRPADEGVERDPEDTRDMLWLYLEKQNNILDRNFDHQTDAINRCADAVDAIREAQDQQDQRHTDAQLLAAEKMANAQIEAAEKMATARKFEAKMAAILAAFLIVGVIILAGASIGVKYQDTEVNAGHGAP